MEMEILGVRVHSVSIAFAPAPSPVIVYTKRLSPLVRYNSHPRLKLAVCNGAMGSQTNRSDPLHAQGSLAEFPIPGAGSKDDLRQVYNLQFV